MHKCSPDFLVVVIQFRILNIYLSSLSTKDKMQLKVNFLREIDFNSDFSLLLDQFLQQGQKIQSVQIFTDSLEGTTGFVAFPNARVLHKQPESGFDLESLCKFS